MTKGKPVSKRLTTLSLARNLTQRQEHQIIAMADRARTMEQVIDRINDVDMGPRLSTWRHTPCEHSRLLNPREQAQGDEPDYDDACSPCLRDRLRAYLLGNQQ